MEIRSDQMSLLEEKDHFSQSWKQKLIFLKSRQMPFMISWL